MTDSDGLAVVKQFADEMARQSGVFGTAVRMLEAGPYPDEVREAAVRTAKAFFAAAAAADEFAAALTAAEHQEN